MLFDPKTEKAEIRGTSFMLQEYGVLSSTGPKTK